MDRSAADAAGAATMNTTSKHVLRARGIGKTVKSGDSDLVILRDIDLAVTPAEAVAVVGAPGSGQSTVLAILAGLDTPTKRVVVIHGPDIFFPDEDKTAVRRGRAGRILFPTLLPP